MNYNYNCHIQTESGSIFQLENKLVDYEMKPLPYRVLYKAEMCMINSYLQACKWLNIEIWHVGFTLALT